MDKKEIAARAEMLRRLLEPPTSDSDSNLGYTVEEKIRFKNMYDSGFVDCVIRYDEKGNPAAFAKIKVLDSGREFVHDFDHPPFPLKKWTLWTGFWIGTLGLLWKILESNNLLPS